MDETPTYVYPDYRAWRDMWGIVECQDPILSRIFQEQAEQAGLTGLDIELLTPEEPEHFPYKEHDLATSGGNRKEGYWIEVTISPNGLWDHLSDNYGTWNETLRDWGLQKYAHLDWYDIFRKVVSRQLTIIKLGLKDDEARIDFVIGHLYTYCVDHPRRLLRKIFSYSKPNK